MINQSQAKQTGMYYGWYVVITAMFIAAVTTGARNGFGVFVIPMSEAFDWSRTTISIAAAMGWLVNGVTQPLIGHVFDRYNSRRVILVSLVVAGLATAALSFTFHILFLVFMFSFVLSAAMSGASIGTLGPLLARWFQRKRTTVLGLVVAGSSMGSLLLVPFSAYLVEVTNWRISWAVLGFIIIAVALPLALFFLRSRPSDLGLQPDGDPDPAQNAASERRRGLFEVDQWWRSFRSRPIWHLSASYTVCGVTVGLISIHFVPYAQEHVGVSPTTAGIIFGYMMGLNVLGGIGGGMLADRFGRKNVLGAVYFVRFIAYAALVGGLIVVQRDISIPLLPGPPGLISLWVLRYVGRLLLDRQRARHHVVDCRRLRSASLGGDIRHLFPVSSGRGLRKHHPGGGGSMTTPGPTSSHSWSPAPCCCQRRFRRSPSTKKKYSIRYQAAAAPAAGD